MKNNILGKIQKNIDQVKTDEKKLQEYLSTFNFETFEIDEDDKIFIINQEKVFIDFGKKYSDSLYRICTSLYEVQDRFKKSSDLGFVAWYTHMGLNKDKVSELLKRAYLYWTFPKYEAFISSLSGLAVRILTHKNVDYSLQKIVIEKQITTSSEIKQIIKNEEKLYSQQLVEIPSFKYFNFKNIEKIQRSIPNMQLNEISNVKKEIDYLKKILKNTEQELALKEEEFKNKDNLKLY